MNSEMAPDNMEVPLEEEGGHLDNEMDFCVVCLSKIKSLTLIGTGGGENNSCGEGYHDYHDNFLSKNLDVIFILKNLMQVPEILLKNNLKSFGNPEDWGMSLCADCRRLTSEAKLLHVEILKLETKLRLVQQLILGKVRLSSESESRQQFSAYLNDKVKKSKKKEIWRKMRYFVKNLLDKGSRTEILPPVNPFIEGDKLAKLAESQKKIITSARSLKISLDSQDYEENFPIQIKSEPLNISEDNQDDYLDYDDDPPSSPFLQADVQEDKPRKKKKKSGKKIKAVCDLCGERFSSRKGLSQHLIQDHDKMLVSCYLCEIGVKDDNMLKIHMLEEHKEEAVVRGWKKSNYWYCQVKGCEMKYTRPTGLGEHRKKMHNGGKGGLEGEGGVEKRFKCGICGKGFWNDSKRRRHELIHKRVGWRCEVCGREFRRKLLWECHKRKEHKVKEEKDNGGDQ